jgi:hypothetical protein
MLLSVLLVLAGLIGLLLLNTLVNQDSFRVGSLEAHTTALDERAQVLATELARLQAPSTLATRAQARGLVPGATPAFVRLADGRITGTPARAVAPPPPAPPAPPPAKVTTAPKPVRGGELVEVTDLVKPTGGTATTSPRKAAARRGVLQEVATPLPAKATTPGKPVKTARTPATKPVLELVTTPAGAK